MPDELDLDLPISQAVKLLHTLMQSLYLSTACAAGQHHQCHGVDRFRSLICCCIECGHTRHVGTPLLHHAETAGERDAHHAYEPGGQLGVRTDLVQALEKTLDEWMPHIAEDARRTLAIQCGITACLTFAPRSL
ncbi:hypothetical protein [Streptomyces drozdowiczii]